MMSLRRNVSKCISEEIFGETLADNSSQWNHYAFFVFCCGKGLSRFTRGFHNNVTDSGVIKDCYNFIEVTMKHTDTNVTRIFFDEKL